MFFEIESGADFLEYLSATEIVIFEDFQAVVEISDFASLSQYAVDGGGHFRFLWENENPPEALAGREPAVTRGLSF
jgi:hypothetical protein